MALQAAELAAQLQQTDAFIAADETLITVSRKISSRVPGGGVGGSAQPLATTRRVRLIPAGDSSEAATSANIISLGTEVRRWTLMAMPTEDLKKGDTFAFGLETLEIITLTPGEYELKGEVRTRG
jgi:hypothetical protein